MLARRAAAKRRSPGRSRGSATARRAIDGAASGGKIRYAVVGLGHIAQAAILPAFAHAQHNSTLAALVSDDRKLRKLSRRYDVHRVCGYDEADELFETGENFRSSRKLGGRPLYDLGMECIRRRCSQPPCQESR